MLFFWAALLVGSAFFAPNLSDRLKGGGFEKCTYGLELDDVWNIRSLPHLGRHADDYHEWVLDRMTEIDELAQGSRLKFRELFEELVIGPVMENPLMLRKAFWDEW